MKTFKYWCPKCELYDVDRFSTEVMSRKCPKCHEPMNFDKECIEISGGFSAWASYGDYIAGRMAENEKQYSR